RIGATLYGQQALYWGSPAIYLGNRFANQLAAVTRWAGPIRQAIHNATAGILRTVQVHPNVLRLNAGQVFERVLNPITKVLGGRAQQVIAQGAARPDW